MTTTSGSHRPELHSACSPKSKKLTTATLSASELGSGESDRADILKQRGVGIGVFEDDLGSVQIKVELVGEASEIKSGGHV
jgi:hypothetical protein